MKIKAIILFALAAAVAGFAQGPNDGPISRIEMTDLYSMNAAKYSGVKFQYHNLFAYNPANPLLMPPFPYVGGRVRDGKYKASQTALDNYIKEFAPKYNGKLFTVVKFEQNATGMPALIIACENGDTLYYASISYAGAEFINKDFLNAEKKKVGSKFFYKGGSYNQQYVSNYKNQPTIIRSVAFRNVKTKEYEFFFPSMSEWKILDVSYDTEYVGTPSVMNDGVNAYLNRIKYTIENKTYGKYEAYLQDASMKQKLVYKIDDDEYFSYFSDGNEENYSIEDLQNIKTWAANGDDASSYLLAKIEEKKQKNSVPSPKNDILSQEIVKCAQKGYIYAVADVASAGNVSAEDKFRFIDIAKKRYGDSKAYQKFNSMIAGTVYKFIYEINDAPDINAQMAIYEKMIKEYSLIEKKGILTFEVFSQTQNVKTELENIKKRLSDLKRQRFQQGEVEILEKEKAEKEAELKRLSDAVLKNKNAQDEAMIAITKKMNEINEEYKKTGDKKKYKEKKDALSKEMTAIQKNNSYMDSYKEFQNKASILAREIKELEKQIQEEKRKY